MQYLIFGLIAGVLSGIFGIGGGVVIVPALILIAKFPPARATGTSLAALLLPVGALGVWKYFERGDVDISSALLISCGLLAGAWFGADIALKIPSRDLQRAFSLFLMVISGYLWWSA
jgi:uncharacterized membrane protein YfcA